MSHSGIAKIAVILGYTLILALAIAGIAWIYTEFLDFSEKAETLNQQKELVVLSNTLATMYQAEGTAGLQAIAADPNLSQEYDSLMRVVFYQIDSLKTISLDNYLNEHLDSLHILLTRKQENSKELVRLLESLEKNTIKEITQTSVFARKDLNFLDDLLIDTTQQIEDTTVIVGERKGFFRRIGDAIRSDRPDTLRQYSSQALTTTENRVIPMLKDTLVEFIQEVNQIAIKRNAAIFTQVIRRQSELYVVNENTTAQINRIMSKLEEIEYKNAIQKMEERESAIERSTKIVSMIALAAILVAILFMTWILRSISAAQRLHKEIATEKKNVEKLLAAREQLMMMITHDIKSPISSIIGYLELMRKDKPASQEAYYIENMQHSASHILNLVRNLLDFHSLDINKQKADLRSFSPFKLITNIYESFIPVAQEKELIFDISMDIDKNAHYLSDPYRIHQILNNILSNAVKFTPQRGTVQLCASLDETKKNASLIVSVKDTGPGIKQEDKEIVFEEFKRLNYSSSGIEGTGLGLSISVKLAQLLGGSIDLNSTVGKGSIFTITIPLQPITNAKEKSIHIADKRTALPMKDIDKSQLRILFIDDDVVHLNLLSELLKREGVIPCVCSSSLDALELLQKERFDIVFSDIQMPDMNGFELVECIRMSDFDGSVTIPIVGLSANSHLSESKYKEAGFCEFLAKPFVPEQLFELIYKYTGKGNLKLEDISFSEKNAFSSLLRFAGDDPDAEKLIMQSFIEESKKNIVLLTQAFNENDWETVGKVAHKMRPLMRMIAAPRIISILEDYDSGSQSKENEAVLLNLIWEKIKEAEEFLNQSDT
jgi:signal transduction histidine kinase/CheY-like chemotaxis protein